MNVLALTSSYPRRPGDPTAPFIESITRGIAARGHTIHLVLPDHRDLRRRPAEDGIHFHPYRYSPLRGWTPWGYSESLQEGTRIKRVLYPLAPLVLLAALKECSRVGSRERFDVVHAHWVVPNGPVAALAARRAGAPLVVSLHGSDVSVSEHSGLIGRATRWTFEQAAAVTAPSGDLVSRARALGAREPVEHLPYGADARGFAPDAEAAQRVRAGFGFARDAFVVLGVGRFVRWKGFDTLISSTARAREQVPHLQLVLVGDGDLRAELEQLVDGLRVRSSVHFTGMVSRDELPAYFAAADAVAVPSVHHDGYVDGLPNVALEAMAAGRPLVATQVGGLPEIVVHDETGLLVEERDPDSLAAALVELARHPDLRQRLGEHGARRIREDLNWDAVAERFIAVLEAARSTHRRTGELTR